MMIKLLAIDLDHTCLNDHHRISQETLDALNQLHQEGVMIVPTTGRALSCLPHDLNNIPFLTYVISSNGARITNVKSHEDLYRSEIKYEDVVSFLSKCQSYQVKKTLHLNHQYYIEGNMFYHIGRLIYGKDAKKAIAIKNMNTFIKETKKDVEEIQLFYFNQKTRNKLKTLLNDEPQLSSSYSDYYVEIYSKGTSKGNALKILAKELHIKKEEIACIGDGENDMSMFNVSGLRLAMGNAVDELKAKADFILPTNNQNGICEALKYFRDE